MKIIRLMVEITQIFQSDLRCENTPKWEIPFFDIRFQQIQIRQAHLNLRFDERAPVNTRKHYYIKLGFQSNLAI